MLKRICNFCRKNYVGVGKKFCSHKCYSIFSRSLIEEKSKNWKGNNIGYAALHIRIGKKLKKPKFCQKCHKNFPHDLANISGKYKKELFDWEWLCRKCHMKKDGRLEKIRKTNNHLILFNNKKLTISKWSKKLNINYGSLLTRINKLHWSTKKAFLQPIRNHKEYNKRK